MIIIQDKYNADIKIPRNPSYNGRFELRIFSPIGLWEKSYYVVDDYSSKQFYHFQLDLWNLPDGEFNYVLESEESGDAAATGIIQVGNGKAEDEYLQYEYEIEYIQYYPFSKEILLKVSDSSLEYDVTEIEFTIYSNVDWVYTIYRNGAQYGETTHGTTGKTVQTIEIPENDTKELVVWEIACADEEGDLSAISKKIWQYGLPLSVSITTPNPTIAASATTIPFTVTYDEWQTTRTGTIYLFKDGTENDSMPLNYYPLTFSSAFTISPNQTEEEINYDLKVVVKAEGSSPMISAATSVVQEGTEIPEETYLIMSADSYSLAAEDTSLSWGYSANTNWTLTAITPWGTGVSQKTAGSDTPIFYFEQNTTLSARTFTYKGQTADGQVTQTLTFVQAASATTPIDYSTKRLTIEMLEDGDIYWEGGSVYYDIIRNGVRDEGYQLYHSIDNLEAGDVIEFYVDRDVEGNPYFQYPITSTARHIAYGNVMSLYYVEDYEDIKTLPNDYSFYELFKGNTGLVSAENLILPATALTSDCYYAMFSGCTSLQGAPALPATSIARSCYNSMFAGCTSLDTAPSLPATNLSGANYCYSSMFKGCTSLVNVQSALPATTLADYCYSGLFYGCTSLVNAPALPATSLKSDCYRSMFERCTSLETAPELPATLIASYSYVNMFKNCTSLNYVKCLGSLSDYDYDTANWLQGASPTGDFWKMSSANWRSGNSGIPEGWTSHNIDI